MSQESKPVTTEAQRAFDARETVRQILERSRSLPLTAQVGELSGEISGFERTAKENVSKQPIPEIFKEEESGSEVIKNWRLDQLEMIRNSPNTELGLLYAELEQVVQNIVDAAVERSALAEKDRTVRAMVQDLEQLRVTYSLVSEIRGFEQVAADIKLQMEDLEIKLK